MKNFLIFVMGCVLSIPFSVISQTVETFTSSGSWVCPVGITSVTVECWGAGGGGGARNGTAGLGGGGGGGAYARSTINVTAGTTYYYSIGTGAAALDGGNSWFNASTTNPYTSVNSAPTGSVFGVLAEGGRGVTVVNTPTGALGGLSSNSFGTIKWTGGTGGTGSAYSGSGGGAAGTSTNGGNGSGASLTGGSGGSGNPNTGNGASGVSAAVAGNTGETYGGGGSGAKTTGTGSKAGGAGAAGIIKITYTCSPVSSYPWTEGFESGYTDATAIGGCWSQVSTTGSAAWNANNTATDYNRTPRTGSYNGTLYYSNEDWLFYPFTFIAGNTYSFEMYARQDGAISTDANITVGYGASASSAAMTNTIVAQTGIVDGGYQLLSGSFSPASTGTYYVGIKGSINSTPWYISIDDIKVDVAAAMNFSSCTTTQSNTTSVAPGSTSQEIIGMQVVTTGTTSPLTASSFTFNITGSTVAANIANAKLWTSGTSSTFATTTQLGSATVNPSGSFTITGGTNMPYTLSSGTNYFWLTYDIVASPVMGNVVDATCTSITVTSARTPTVTSPSGSRTIALAYCSPAPTSVDGTGITNVTCGSINNTTGTETNNYGDYSSQSTTIQQGEIATVNITYSTGFTYDTKIWVDWNVDGDFGDAGEEVFSGTSAIDNPTTLAASFTLPVGASLGNHRMRIGGVDSGTLDPCYTSSYGSFEDYMLNITAASPMAFSSCTTTQLNTNAVAPGSTSQEIIGLQVVTTGVTSPLTASSFTFNITGSSVAANIANAKLWTSGTSSAFATTTQLGSATVSPSGSFTIAGGANMPYTLSNGINYFWLTYDIVASPTLNDVVDATCTSIMVSSARTPTVTAPSGSRTISLNYCTPTYSSGGSTDNLAHIVLETLDDTPPANNSPYYYDRSSLQNDIPILNISQTHTLSVTVGSDGNQYTRAWIDFNHDGDFDDAGESFDGGYSLADATATISISVPGGALSGQTRMRIRGGDDSAIGIGQSCGASGSIYGQGVDYFVNIAAAVNMSYVSSTSTQLNTNVISAGTSNQEIICMKVVTAGSLNPISATEFRMRTDGTTAYATDIRNAKIWYTGNSSTFSTSNQLGSTVATPPTSGADMVFIGTQTLSPGTNYFWLTYDVPSGAVNGNFVDAKFQSVIIAATNRTPTVSTPTEKRDIIRGCFYTLTLIDDACDGWNGGKLTVKVNGVSKLTDVTFTSGCSTTFQFVAESGQTITTEYIAGSSSSENSYVITNPNGAYVTSSGEAQSVPINTSATADCNLVKQFTTNVDSYQSGVSCFIITEGETSQKGSIWSNYKIDMTQNFSIAFDLFMGDSDGGADGVVFALQGSCTSAGGNGNSMGYAGIENSIGVEFDTYNNESNSDLTSDHIAIISDGSADHGGSSNLAGPLGLSDLENNAWHSASVSWNATSQIFKIKYGTSDSLTYNGDIVTNLFGGNTQVFWGFTGATGLYYNTQKVCITSYPQNTTQVADTTINAGDSVAVQVAIGASSYSWIPDDGSVSNTTVSNPVLSPAVTTEYTCLLEDGCGKIITNKFTVQVNSNLPIELLDFSANCQSTGAELSWSTATETNNNYFILEKSTDMVFYQELTRINGVGNATTTNNYSYLDRQNNGMSYYRLTQVDYNGNTIAFKPISADCNFSSNFKPISIYPNPATEWFSLGLPKEVKAKVQILNMIGMGVSEIDEITSASIIEVSNLAKGVYMVKVLIGNEIYYCKLNKH